MHQRRLRADDTSGIEIQGNIIIDDPDITGLQNIVEDLTPAAILLLIAPTMKSSFKTIVLPLSRSDLTRPRRLYSQAG